MASRTASTASALPTAVAAVVLDGLPAHLARTWEYLIPADLTADTRVGCRITVTFGRRRRTGYVISLRPAADDDTALMPLTGLVSAVPVLTDETIRLAKAVADRYAGTHADVLRLAVPERRAAAETEPAAAPLPVAVPDTSAWQAYTHGEAYVRALAAGKAPRAVWNTRPGEHWARRFAEAAAACAATGRGAVLVVPDQTRLALLDRTLTDVLNTGRHVALTSGMGSTPRYRAYLRAVRGDVRIVAGTRSAALTPVTDLGLVAIWDDGALSHTEQRAPYLNARDTLLTRAHLAGCAVLIGGNARTPQAQLLVDTGWAVSITPVSPKRIRVHTTGTDTHLQSDGTPARIPTFAWKTAKTALDAGQSVLVQVPRTGYVHALACAKCFTRATCPACTGPLTRNETGPLTCTRCGPAPDHTRCSECGSPNLRAEAIGTRRTCWELAKAFPAATVTESTSAGRIDAAPAGPSIVVATPGNEPPAADGYGAVLILDAWTLINRPEWNAHEQALRRWMNAVALANADAAVAIVAEGTQPVVQALIRWDAAWFARQQLTEREPHGFPPHQRYAAVIGPTGEPKLACASLPAELEAEIIGPLPVYGSDAGDEQVLVRVPRRSTTALAAALRTMRSERFRTHQVPLQVRMDPSSIN